MRLNFTLIRDLMIKIEKSCNTYDDYLDSEDIELIGYTNEEIAYHLQLLFDKDYVDVIDTVTHDSDYFECIVKRLTMQGHEFLNSIRDDNVWSETKSRISKVGFNVTLDIVKSVAITVLHQFLGIK